MAVGGRGAGGGGSHNSGGKERRGRRPAYQSDGPQRGGG